MSSPPSRSSPPDPGPQRQTRIRLERKVSLKFKDLEGFVTELSENISMGGMFLRTSDAPAPGTLFDFELTLEQEGPVIQGIAEVVWVREQTEGPRQPAGMGVRFLELAPGSRALIYQVVDEHIVAGGEPFELGGTAPIPPASAATAGSDRGTPTGTRTVRAGSYAVLASPQHNKTEEGGQGWRTGGRRGGTGRGSRRRVLLAGAAVLVAIGVWAVFPGLPTGEPEPAEPASAAESSADAASTDAAPTDAAPADSAQPRSSPRRDRLDAVVPDPAGRRAETETGRELEAQPGAQAREEARAQDAPAEAEPPDTDPSDETAEDPVPETRGGDNGDPAATKPAAVLDDITWRRQGETLVVTLRADGAFFDDRWDRFRMDEGTPREVIRIRGIRERHRPSIEVDEPELLRIRTGLHRTARGDELHVVLDLASPRVRLVDADSDGRELRLTLHEGG